MARRSEVLRKGNFVEADVREFANIAATRNTHGAPSPPSDGGEGWREEVHYSDGAAGWSRSPSPRVASKSSRFEPLNPTTPLPNLSSPSEGEERVAEAGRVHGEGVALVRVSGYA